MIPAATATSGTQKSASACWWTGSIQIAQAEQPSITKASARSGRRRNARTAARPPAAAHSPHPTRQSSRSIENMETVGPHGLRTVVDNGHWPEHSRNRTTLRMRPAAPAAPSLVDLSQDGHDRSNGGARSASQRGPLVGGQGLCQAEPDSTPRRVGPGRPLVVFRARRRGTAVEATICDVLSPTGTSPKRAWKALKGAGVD